MKSKKKKCKKKAYFVVQLFMCKFYFRYIFIKERCMEWEKQ